MGGTHSSEQPCLSADDLDQVLERQRRSGDSLGRCLVAQGCASEEVGLRALAQALDVQFVDISATGIDPEAARLVPGELLHRERVVPVHSDDGALLLAMADPLDFETVDYIRILTGRDVRRAVCTEDDLEEAMQNLHGLTVETMIEHFSVGGAVEPETAEIGQLREMASEPTVVNLVNLIVVRAVRARASDIHRATSTSSRSRTSLRSNTALTGSCTKPPRRRCTCTRPSSAASRSWPT
ncbi:MAG: hypothetical protein R6V05_10515 [Candidatus Brocadiia bacterium]